jgi:hypothetical protein
MLAKRSREIAFPSMMTIFNTSFRPRIYCEFIVIASRCESVPEGMIKENAQPARDCPRAWSS